MYQMTTTLLNLMKDYNIDNLAHGAKEDKLGDVYEDYCVKLLSSQYLLEKAKKGEFFLNNIDSLTADEFIFYSVFTKNIIPDIDSILSLSATRNIEHRITGGNPKTDIIIDITTITNLKIQIPISVKQTKASKVAMAEFDVNTIVKELDISDESLINLLLKHQTDASAKRFTEAEKNELMQKLKPYKQKFVKWVITGCPNESTDLRYPKLLIKFNLDKKNRIKNITCFTIDEYLKYIMFSKHGEEKKGGFGTGLSWTYATGSKGQKIQFKG